MILQFKPLLVGFFGFLFIILIRAKSLSNDAQVANLPFNIWKDYIVKDIYGVIAGFLSPFIWLFLFGEISAKYPGLEGFTLTSFFVMGALGSWVLQLLLGKAKGAIRKVVDEKTDIADNKETKKD